MRVLPQFFRELISLDDLDLGTLFESLETCNHLTYDFHHQV